MLNENKQQHVTVYERVTLSHNEPSRIHWSDLEGTTTAKKLPTEPQAVQACPESSLHSVPCTLEHQNAGLNQTPTADKDTLHGDTAHSGRAGLRQVAEGDAILCIRNLVPWPSPSKQGRPRIQSGHSVQNSQVHTVPPSVHLVTVQCRQWRHMQHIQHSKPATVSSAPHKAHLHQVSHHGMAKGTSLATRKWLWMDLERATEVQCQAGPARP